MKIKSIKIKNFKCHKKIDLSFDEKFTALIGENDAGKSSILDFLEFILTNKKISEYKDFYFKEYKEANDTLIETESFEGEIIFELNSMDSDGLMPYNKYIENTENKELKVKRACDSSKDKYLVWTKCYNETFLNNYKKEGVTKLREFIKNQVETNKIETIKRISQFNLEKCIKIIDENIHLYPSKWDYCEIEFNNIKNLLPDFIKYDSENYDKPINLVKNALELVFKNVLYELDENKKIFKRDENNRPIIKNQKLKEVYEKSIKLLNVKADEFKEHVESIINHIDISIHPEIDFSSGFKPGEMKIKNKNTGVETNYENNGAGTKQRLYMAIFEWQQEVEKNLGQNFTIKCFDEPDNNLHISAQKKLLKTLKTTNEKVQTIITTHSLFMVDTVKADSIRLLKRDENFDTKVEKLEVGDDEELKQFIHEMCREMGLSNSHIFFEKCFLLVEGEGEENYIPTAYKNNYNNTLAEDGIVLINLKGNGAAANFLKLLAKNKKQQILLLLDTDTNDSKVKIAIDKLIDNNVIYKSQIEYVGEKEFEDIFSDEILADVLNKNYELQKTFTQNDIRTLRLKEKFSDELKKLVALNNNSNGQFLTKPDLAIHLSKEEVPERLLEVFQEMRRIAEV